jgi:hypothetical protein
MALYNVAVGGLPQASDLNQLIDIFSGAHDIGTLSLAPVVSAPATTGFALTGQAGTTLGVGAYNYQFTYVTGYYKSDGTLVITGETPASSALAITTTTGSTTVKVTLPVPAIGAICATRIYRTAVGGSTYGLVATVKDGTTVYTDSTADASRGAVPPSTNTTGTDLQLNNQAISGISNLNGQFGLIARSYDEWLRINDDGSHVSGTYFGSGVVRTDGQLQVGNAGAKLLVDANGNVSAAGSISNTGKGNTGANYMERTSTNSAFYANQLGTGNIADFQVAGTSKASILNSGVFNSTVATGTAPFTVASTTKVTNLNADQLDGLDSASFIRSDTADSFTGQLTSTLATGTAPFVIASTTAVTNLNADMVDGLHVAQLSGTGANILNTIPRIGADGVTELAKYLDFHDQSATTQTDYDVRFTVTGSGTANAGTLAIGSTMVSNTGSMQASAFTSTVATGTAPFTVASTTKVTNLNADLLDGLDSASFLRSDAADSFSGQLTSTLANGTAPFVIASSTAVTNLNADLLDGLHATDFQRADGTTSIQTASTGGTYGGQYTKVATINITAQYGFVNTSLLFMAGADGSTNLRKAIVDIRVKQQAAMASAPIYELDLVEANGGVVAGDFVAVVSVNTATATTVDLYFRISNTYEQYSFVSLVKNASSGTLALLTGQSFIATLPTGTQITCTDITKAKKTGDTFTGAVTATSFTSNVATGTAPFTVASTTKVTNLNADQLDGLDSTSFLRSDAADSFSGVLTSTVATGTAPFVITSTTKVANLNADMVDGYTLDQDVQTTASPTFAGLSVNAAPTITKTSGQMLTFKQTDYVTGGGMYQYIGFGDDTGAWKAYVGFSSSRDNVLILNNSLGDVRINPKTGSNTHIVGTADATGNITAPAFVSNVAVGTAPFTVTSTTPVANLAIGGNAGSATKLQTARTIATSGDATGTATSFDGSANITIPLTLAASGVTAGTYKSVTVDAKGRVTGGTNPITLAGYGITDVDNTNYGIVAGSNANGSYVQYPDGTMICWASIAAVAGTTIENTGILTYPVTFIAQPYTTIQHYSLAGKFANWYIYNNATNGFTLYHQGLAGVDLSTTSFRWIAIGKWK